MQDFRRLRVWQLAVELAEEVHRALDGLPSTQENLADQIRRAVNSIHANIAEGAGRPTQRDFHRYLGIGVGSASELESHLYVAQRLQYLSDGTVVPLIAKAVDVRRMQVGLMNRVRRGRSSRQASPSDVDR